MALTPTVLYDALLIVGGTTVSDHVQKIEVPFSAKDLDTSAMGSIWEARVLGMRVASLNCDFIQDFVAAQLDATFWPWFGTNQTFEVRATSAARGVGNPAYTGTIAIGEWKPVMGKVGDLAIVSVSFKTSGVVLRQTS